MDPRSNAMNGGGNPHPIGSTATGRAKMILAVPFALPTALVLTAIQPAAAQPGMVLSHQKISNTQGGFTGILDDSDFLGEGGRAWTRATSSRPNRTAKRSSTARSPAPTDSAAPARARAGEPAADETLKRRNAPAPHLSGSDVGDGHPRTRRSTLHRVLPPPFPPARPGHPYPLKCRRAARTEVRGSLRSAVPLGRYRLLCTAWRQSFGQIKPPSTS